jgi:hypothetical protein
MKNIWLLASLLLATQQTFAKEYQHFAEIQKAVLHGRTIRLVMDLANCTSNPSSVTAVKSFIAGVFIPNAIMVKLNERMTTSLHHFTLNNVRFPNKPVFEFVHYTLSMDDTLTLTSQTLDAIHYAPLSEKTSFQCRIGKSARVFA